MEKFFNVLLVPTIVVFLARLTRVDALLDNQCRALAVNANVCTTRLPNAPGHTFYSAERVLYPTSVAEVVRLVSNCPGCY